MSACRGSLLGVGFVIEAGFWFVQSRRLYIRLVIFPSVCRQREVLIRLLISSAPSVRVRVAGGDLYGVAVKAPTEPAGETHLRSAYATGVSLASSCGCGASTDYHRAYKVGQRTNQAE